MMEMAVRIDNRLWERKIEKQEGKRPQGGFQKGHNKGNKGKYSDPYGLQPMDIDSRKTTNEPDKKKKNGKCYYCEKLGHFARECRKKQADKEKRNEQARATKEEKARVSDEQARATTTEEWKNPCSGRQEDKCNDWYCRNHFSTKNPARDAAFASEDRGYRPPVREHDSSDVRHPEHDLMHWATCYDDECLTHLYGKQGAYYPKPPRNYSIQKRRYESIWRLEQTKKTEIDDFEVVEEKGQALITRTVEQFTKDEWETDKEKPEQLQQRQLKINPEDLKQPSEGFGAKPRSPTLTIKTLNKKINKS